MIFTDGIHLVSTDLEELHAFAQKIGLDRRWYREKGYRSHYVLTSPKMAERALSSGAGKVITRSVISSQFQPSPPAKKGRPEKIRRPMTEDEKVIAKALSACRFGLGSFDKRFSRNMSLSTMITERQAEILGKMAYRYRGQIGDAWIKLQGK